MATLIRSDLEFILQQILIAEAHAAGADLASLLPNQLAMLGLRTVDGSYNNIVPGQQFFGAADQPFPTLLEPSFLPPYNSPGPVIDVGAAHDLQPDRRPDHHQSSRCPGLRRRWLRHPASAHLSCHFPTRGTL